MYTLANLRFGVRGGPGEEDDFKNKKKKKKKEKKLSSGRERDTERD